MTALVRPHQTLEQDGETTEREKRECTGLIAQVRVDARERVVDERGSIADPKTPPLSPNE